MSSKKQAVKDILKMVLSNVLSLACGILMGFFIPKIMGYTDYGYYKTFALYAGYTGLLHFGISDGIYFYFSGQKLQEINKEKLHSAIVFVFILEALISAVGIGIAAIFIGKTCFGLIFVFVFLYNFFSHVQNVLSLVCQATKQFSFPSLANSLKSLFDGCCVIVLYLLYKNREAFEVNFSIYCLVIVLSMAIEAVFFVVKLWKIIFSKGEDSKLLKEDLFVYFKLGFPLMIANLTSSLIVDVDRQFVSIFYPVDLSNTFSIFSFAYSVLSLVTAVTSAISTVLFPYMKGKDNNSLIDLYPKLDSFLLVFVSGSCASFFIVEWAVEKFISKYSDSMLYIRILIPGLIISSSITVLMHNYYKFLNKERIYFWQNVVVLLLAIVTDFIAYYCIILPFDSSNPVWLTVASDFTMIIWYLISEWYLVKLFHIRHIKNDCYLFASCLSFFVIAFFFHEWIGLIIFSGAFIVLTICFFYKEIRGFFGLLRKKSKSNPTT